jgi:hypothetical protein
MYPNTTSIICRNTFTNLKATIAQNTFPEMMKLRFGEESASNKKFIKYNMSSPMTADFYNGSRVYFIGLEDNSNFEKILGRKANIFLIDEASEIGYKAFSKLTTRMSSTTGARHIGFVTMNPTSVFHWPYKLFIEKKNPIDDTPLKRGEFFKCLQMNPQDNIENLPDGYIENLENLSEFEKQRFLFGQFLTTTEDAVYEKEINEAKEEGRLEETVNIEPNYPLYIALDIGWDDFNSGWVFQVLPFGIVFYEYLEENKVSVIDFLGKIKEKIRRRLKGKWLNDTTVILPHDASHHWAGTGMTLKATLNLNAAWNIDTPLTFKVLEVAGIYEGINAARIMFKKCSFDKVGCDIGIRRLGQYKETIQDGNDEFKKKVKHDMASHAADAFRYAITAFYFQKAKIESVQREKGKMYGEDLLRRQTRERMNII